MGIAGTGILNGPSKDMLGGRESDFFSSGFEIGFKGGFNGLGERGRTSVCAVEADSSMTSS